MKKVVFEVAELTKAASAFNNADTKATVSKTKAIIALFDSADVVKANGGYESLKDADKRKVLDCAKDAINSEIEAMKVANKKIDSSERKPLKENKTYSGLRSMLGLVAANRTRLLTDAEKKARSEKTAKEKAEREAKIVQSAIDAGKVVDANSIVEVETTGNIEEAIFSIVLAAKAKGWTREKILKAVEASCDV